MSRGPRDAETEYIRHLIDEWVDKQGKTVKALAESVGVRGPTLSMIRVGDRGAGQDTIAGFARIFTEDSLDAFRSAAQKWWRAQGIPPVERVVYVDRYPNRARAIRAARELGRSEAAIAIIANVSFKDQTDPSPDEWLKDIDAEERRLSREQRDPVGTARAAVDNKARSDAYLEQLAAEPDFEARLKAIKARRDKEKLSEAEPARKTGLKPAGKKK